MASDRAPRPAILLVEDSPQYARELTAVLGRELPDVELRTAATLEEALEALARGTPDLVLLDMMFPLTRADAAAGRVDPRAGARFLEEGLTGRPSLRVVIVSSQDKQAAVDLLLRFRQVTEYLFKDTAWKEVTLRLSKHLEAIGQARQAAGAARAALVGRHPEIERVRALIAQVAPTDSTVLVTGESGTGKELAARMVHDLSGRWAGPFVAINAACLSAELLASELFGHRKGSFTGALEDREGKLEAADLGTLFLDEIGELDLDLQPRLLRVLQDRHFERVGENRLRRADVRIVAATNQDLAAAVKAGRFRADLYYRIAVLPIRIPPLRERRSDVSVLAMHFVEELDQRMGRQVRSIDQAALERLEAHDWPGNVRELANVIERAMILARSQTLGLADVATWLSPLCSDYQVEFPADASDYQEAKREVLAAFDRTFLTRFLRKNRGNLERTAQAIGYNRKDLRRRLSELQIDRSEFKESSDDDVPGGA